MYRISTHHRKRSDAPRGSVRTAAMLLLSSVLTAALILAAPAAAVDRERMSDAKIAELVQHRLAKKDLDEIGVSVQDAKVTLSGTADTLQDETQAIKVARRTDDVEAVQSTLEIDTSATVQDVAAGVSKAFQKYPFYSIFDWIEASVEGRTVELSGSVHQPWRRDAMIRRVESVPGVTEVVDDIEVQRPSAFDDSIRYAVADAIYSDLMFAGRGNQFNPPIHIVVDDGRVTLEGVVRNQAEKALARSLASFAATSIGPVDNNLRTSAEIDQ